MSTNVDPIKDPSQLPGPTSVASPGTNLTFPQSAMVGSLGDLARLLARGTEVPEEFYYSCALTLLGAMFIAALASIGLLRAVGARRESKSRPTVTEQLNPGERFAVN